MVTVSSVHLVSSEGIFYTPVVTDNLHPGLFYAGYGAILTPSFGVAAAYGDDTKQLNNALGLFMISE